MNLVLVVVSMKLKEIVQDNVLVLFEKFNNEKLCFHSSNVFITVVSVYFIQLFTLRIFILNNKFPCFCYSFFLLLRLLKNLDLARSSA